MSLFNRMIRTYLVLKSKRYTEDTQYRLCKLSIIFDNIRDEDGDK